LLFTIGANANAQVNARANEALENLAAGI